MSTCSQGFTRFCDINHGMPCVICLFLSSMSMSRHSSSFRVFLFLKLIVIYNFLRSQCQCQYQGQCQCQCHAAEIPFLSNRILLVRASKTCEGTYVDKITFSSYYVAEIRILCPLFIRNISCQVFLHQIFPTTCFLITLALNWSRCTYAAQSRQI